MGEVVAPMSRGRPNWLLLGLLTLSVAAHVLILANIRGLFHHQHTDYIELEVRSKQPGIRTDIPVPPRHKKPHKVINESAIRSVRPVSIPNVIAPGKIPKLDPVASPLIEPIGVPESPDIQVPRVFSYAPPADRENAVPTPQAGHVSRISAQDYLGTIRMLIEQHKKYPMAARKRQMEGRVRLRFVLDLNGKAKSIKVIKGSGHRILDNAAVAAVKDASPFPPPPNGLFDGPVPLEITIVFELM